MPWRVLKRILVPAATMAMLFLHGPASAGLASSGPYHSEGFFESMTPDVTGLGKVAADASAKRSTGEMVSSVSATSDSHSGIIVPTYLGPWGPSVGVGGTWAYAWGEVRHAVNVSSGTYVVSAVFGSVRSAFSSSNTGTDHFGYTSPQSPSSGSVVQLHSVVSYFPCEAGCSPTYSERIVLDLANGASGTFTLTSARFNASATGRVEVRTAVVGWATARGKGASASARGSALLNKIEIS